MQLADEMGLIARPRQLAWQCRPVQQPPGVHEDAVRSRLPTAHQGTSRRHADRARAVGVAKPGTGGGKLVEVGRLQHRVAIDAKAVAALFVRHEEHDVGSGIRHGAVSLLPEGALAGESINSAEIGYRCQINPRA